MEAVEKQEKSFTPFTLIGGGIAVLSGIALVAGVSFGLLSGHWGGGVSGGVAASSTLFVLSSSVVALEQYRIRRPLLPAREPTDRADVDRLCEEHGAKLGETGKAIALWLRQSTLRDRSLVVQYRALAKQYFELNKEDVKDEFLDALTRPPSEWLPGWIRVQDPDKKRTYTLASRNRLTLCGEKVLPSNRVVDPKTGDEYLDETTWLIRYKAYLLTTSTPFAQAALALFQMAKSAFKIGSLMPLWKKEESFGREAARFVLAPLVYVGLEAAAIYTLFCPLEGRKRYAQLERFLYGKEGILLAPCFQPNPTHHLGGDAITTREGL